MAISFSHLDGGNNASPGSSVNTGSITPGSNKLVLVSIASGFSGGGLITPTISGCSMTWELVASDGSNTAGMESFIFRGMASSPTTGALTIDYGGVSRNFVKWSVDEGTGMDTSGTNGSGAIIQSNTNFIDSGASTGITVTLGAFANSGNATFGTVTYSTAGDTVTVGSGFTQLFNDTTTRVQVVEWKNSSDTSVDWTWGSATVVVSACAVEISLPRASGTGFFALL